MNNIIPYILICISAILNAFMDTSCDHFYNSIFSKLNPKFWAMQISWQYSKTVFGYHIDAWHIAKSTMLILIFTSMSLNVRGNDLIHILMNIVIYGILWNIIFNLFYNRIFIKKK